MRPIDADMLIKKYIDTDIEKFNNSDVKIVLENLKQNILKAPTIEPNLVINPDEVERGDVVEIGENIVVIHHDDYYDMFLKSTAIDDGSWERFIANERSKSTFIPSVKSNRPQSKWTNVGILTVQCSNCKSQFHELEAMNFCPKCGADMRKGIDNE